MSEGKSVKKVTHPPTAEMVTVAIKELKDRKGSSLQAIKKYIGTTYKIDADKFSPFIKKFLRASVAAGLLAQPRGHGASGSFKLSVKDAKPSSRKKTASKAKKIVAKKRTTKVGDRKPKAKSTTARPKVTKATKASPKKKVSVTKIKRRVVKSVK